MLLFVVVCVVIDDVAVFVVTMFVMVMFVLVFDYVVYVCCHTPIIVTEPPVHLQNFARKDRETVKQVIKKRQTSIFQEEVIKPPKI